jgi:mannose-6-phosphate isomerase-like protein (cupin superfamily)
MPAVADFDAIPAVPCPCGLSRRAFAGLPDSPVTLHRVDISLDAKVHFHKRLTEVYYVLECDADAALELDGARVPLRPGLAVLIPPFTRHRAIGKMRVLVMAHPQFDPGDEWVTETERAENVTT